MDTPLPPSPPAPSPAPAPIPARPGWWSRNWKWFVPTGCFTLLVLFCAFVGIIMFTVFAAMKSSDVYKTATRRAEANTGVQAALGTPIKEGMFITGNESVNGPSGEANLSIPISGPKGKGTIYIEARKSAGRWSYSTLEVEVPNQKERINLKTAAEE